MGEHVRPAFFALAPRGRPHYHAESAAPVLMPPRVRHLALVVTLALSGCAPSLSPLYRDLEQTPEAHSTDVYERIRAALAEAGWAEAPSAAPNVVSTESREVSDWGLYRVTVSLDVAPVGRDHVRVFFHPVRHYITGGRAKIGSLDAGLRRALLPELYAAFEAQGLRPAGTARERDEAAVDGG